MTSINKNNLEKSSRVRVRHPIVPKYNSLKNYAKFNKKDRRFTNIPVPTKHVFIYLPYYTYKNYQSGKFVKIFQGEKQLTFFYVW